MALQDQVVPLDFGQGLDTKTDPKLVVAGKLLRLENAIFTRGKGLVKRNGYTVLATATSLGGSITAPVLVKSYNGELLCADSGNLYSYAPDPALWVFVGPYQSCEITENVIYSETGVGGYVDSLLVGNYTAYIFENFNPNAVTASAVNVYLKVLDNTTGTVIYFGSVSYLTTGTLRSCSPKCVLLGASTMAITYINSSNHLAGRVITITSSVSVGAEVDLSGARVDNAGAGAARVFYDAANTATGGVITYPTIAAGAYTGFSVITVSTALAITHTVSIADATVDDNSLYYLSPDSATNNIYVYWTRNTDLSLKYAVYSSTLGAVLAATLISTRTADIIGLSCYQIASTTTQCVMFTEKTTQAPATLAGNFTVNVTYLTTVSVAGVITSIGQYAPGLCVLSRSLVVNTRRYALFSYVDPYVSAPDRFHPTYVMVDITTRVASAAVAPYIVARYASELAFYNGYAYVTGTVGMVINLNASGSSAIVLGSSISFEQNTPIDQSFTNFIVYGAYAMKIDFGSQNAYIAKESGTLTVLNGGVVHAYDGNSASELGFHFNPVIIAKKYYDTGGFIHKGVYQYIVVFQWTDEQGNLHQSRTSDAFTVDTTGSANDTNTIDIWASAPYLSTKRSGSISMSVYRTVNLGTTFYLVNGPVGTPVYSSTDLYGYWSDIKPDTSITNGFQLYTTGDVLDNDVLPPSVLIESHINRLILVDSEHRNKWWYGKTYQPSVGIGMSGFLTNDTDPKYGDITAIQEMDDKLILMKKTVPFWVSGDGANDTGAGSSYSTPQIIPSDTGCDQAKSVALLPVGIIRHSPKGFYLLDRSLSDHYIGQAVESYNTQTFTSAKVVEDKNHIRFLTASGSTLVFDYAYNQWSTFTNHLGYAGDVFQGLYTYARTDGKIFQENQTSFLDNATAFNVLLQTSWLALSSVQNYQRVRMILMLADLGGTSGHGISISTAYDFVSTFSTAIPFVFTANPLQYAMSFTRQKCDSMSLLIQETTSGASGEYLNLSNMSLVAGMKKGASPQPAIRSV